MAVDVRTRSTDPSTSFAASASLDEHDLSKTRATILEILREHEDGLTDTAISGHYPYRASESGLRSRRAELVAGGLVVDSGRTEVLPSGRRSIVWAAATDDQRHAAWVERMSKTVEALDAVQRSARIVVDMSGDAA